MTVRQAVKLAAVSDRFALVKILLNVKRREVVCFSVFSGFTLLITACAQFGIIVDDFCAVDVA